MIPFLLHVGFSKAGSTSLQQLGFSKHPDIMFLNAGAHRPPGVDMADQFQGVRSKWIDEFTTDLVYRDQIRWEGEAVRNGLHYKKELEDIRRRSNKKILVYSREQLTNNRAGDNAIRAKRIYNLAPDAKILFVIRNQIDAIRSRYDMAPYHPFLQLPYFGLNKPISFRKYLDINCADLNKSVFNSLFYDRTLDYYAGIFGTRNLLILTLEELKHDPNSFVKKLSEFLGIEQEGFEALIKEKPKNVATNRFIPTWQRTAARLLPSKLRTELKENLRSIQAKKCKKTTVDRESYDRLYGTFAESNAKLRDSYSLPLEQYGYPIAQQ